jgi:hypothetical protein
MRVGDAVREVEAKEAALRLDDDRIRIWFQKLQRREEFSGTVSFLSAHRDEVVEFLRVRCARPSVPLGLRLISWGLKDPPLAIGTCAEVSDPVLFVRTFVEQLRIVLAHPRRWAGWTVRQLIDRLTEVSVDVAVEAERGLYEGSNKG